MASFLLEIGVWEELESGLEETGGLFVGGERIAPFSVEAGGASKRGRARGFLEP
jgi:hypothetical protein